MARGSAFIVRFRIANFLIANVAEAGSALLTIQHVFGVLFAVNLVTFGTLDARSNIHVRVFVKAHKFLNHFLVHFCGQLFANVGPMRRIFLVMLVPFGLLKTLPAEVRETLGALDLGAATSKESYADATFRVWTRSRTLFDVDFVETQSIFSILVVNFFHLILIFI